jgi:hypothetical protein
MGRGKEVAEKVSERSRRAGVYELQDFATAHVF